MTLNKDTLRRHAPFMFGWVIGVVGAFIAGRLWGWTG